MKNANLYLIATVLMAMLPTAEAQQPVINRGVDQVAVPAQAQKPRIKPGVDEVPAGAQKPGIDGGKDQWVDPLTGVWRANDGGTYQIQRDGNRVWWYGRGPKNGQDWQNVFSGTISGNQVTGEWADLPPGGARHSGTITLQVQRGQLTKVSETGGFSGSVWSPVASNGQDNSELSSIQLRSTLGAPTTNVCSHQATPQTGSKNGIGESQQAISAIGIEDVWFNSSAAILERALTSLGGEQAYKYYVAHNEQPAPGPAQILDLRLKALDAIIRANYH